MGRQVGPSPPYRLGSAEGFAAGQNNVSFTFWPRPACHCSFGRVRPRVSLGLARVAASSTRSITGARAEGKRRAVLQYIRAWVRVFAVARESHHRFKRYKSSHVGLSIAHAAAICLTPLHTTSPVILLCLTWRAWTVCAQQGLLPVPEYLSCSTRG